MREEKLPAAQMQSLEEAAQEVASGVRGGAVAAGEGAEDPGGIGRAPTPLPRPKTKKATIKRKTPLLPTKEKAEQATKPEPPKAPEEILLPKHTGPVRLAPLKPRQTMRPVVLEEVFEEEPVEEKGPTAEMAPVAPLAQGSGAIEAQGENDGSDGEYDLYSYNAFEAPEQDRTAKLAGGKPAKMRRKRRRRRAMAQAVSLLLCAALLVAGVLGVGEYMRAEESVPENGVGLNLDALKANGGILTGATLYAVNPDNANEWKLYQRISSQVGEWRELSEMPEELAEAVLAIEQPRFYEQSGMAVWKTLTGGLFGPEGFSVSTIEQQLARRLAGADQQSGTLGRKLHEMAWANMLDATYSKEKILEAYLNTLAFTQGAVGVDGAAKVYFGEDLAELTLAQCATIAGLIYLPAQYDPFANPEGCLARRNLVLQRMRDQGRIDTAAYEQALAEPLGVVQERMQTNVYSWFTDLVYEQLVAGLMEQKGFSRAQAAEFLATTPLKVYTTVDVGLQSKMEKLYVEEMQWFPQVRDENGEQQQTQSAMVVLNYRGEVCGIVGGVGEKQDSLVLNRASQSLVQPGSALRPVSVFAPAIEAGLVSYSSMVEDAPLAAAETGLPEDVAWPQNWDGEPSGERMFLCDAFAQGKNTVAARLGVQVGLEEMAGFATGNAGISSIVEQGHDGVSDKNIAALALGNLAYGVSPLELAAAYQMFGDKGQYSQPCAYSTVLNAGNNEVLAAAPETKQVLGAGTAWVMRALLAQNLMDENGESLAPKGIEAGGYFGRTHDDRSRMFVGMTPQYVSAVWWGTDNAMPLGDVAKGEAADVPLAIWQAVMGAAPHTETGFEQARGCFATEFCIESGLFATPKCTEVRTGYYWEGNLPGDCEMHH